MNGTNRLLGGAVLTAQIMVQSSQAQAPATMVFDRPETAGISGFRVLWDTPVVLAEDGMAVMIDNDRFGSGVSAIWSPGRRTEASRGKAIPYGVWSGRFWEGADKSAELPGALVFDSVHRSLLVRFPEAADAIAAKAAEGWRVERAELVLPYRGVELWAEGYQPPAGMSFLGAHWANTVPRWHAVAWMLRRPWTADPEIGPTYNAAINGADYWTRFGAQDTDTDRYEKRFGPTEVSSNQPLGRLDVTAALNDPAFGSDPSARLRAFADNGLLIRKWEEYDVGYWRGGYEWASAIGGRGILLHAPRLEITFARAKAAKLKLPPPPDISSKAGPLRAAGGNGRPTAVIPDADDLAVYARRYRFERPEWMPEWQWQRVQELHAMGGGRVYPQTPEAYAAWIDRMLSMPPRGWGGFDAVERTQEYWLYHEIMPEPVREHHRRYWTAWLMPDRDITDLVQGYIGGDAAHAYYQRTRDWRGNFSVYRTYVRAMGTMNFNHWATAGVLLGGAIIGSDAMIAEGRHGLEHWPLRTWCWLDGSTQESIDHYYFAHSLTAQKVFADFGPDRLDRMMGESILAKSVEELTSAFHPGLRRFISSSQRTGIAYLLAIQDGLQYIVHSLSRNGALTDTGNAPGDMPGRMPAFGNQLPAGLVGEQALNGPWAPEWAAGMIDDKPLPYEMTVSYKQWGEFAHTPLWRKTWLGQHYGLAGLDVSIHSETVPFMAQWRRRPETAVSARDLGTLIGRYGMNETELLDSIFHGSANRGPNGYVGSQGGHTYNLQHRNKMILLASPVPKLATTGFNRPLPAAIYSLQTTLGLFNYEEPPTWRLFIDDQEVATLPAKARLSQRMAIHDGVTYIGLVPLPATDLGRDAEIVIRPGGAAVEMQGGGHTRPALIIDFYNRKSELPLNMETADWNVIDLAYGGVVIEMGDSTEFADFDAFRRHLAATTLDTRWDAGDNTLHVDYRSGSDHMELGFRPGYAGDWNAHVPTDQCFPYRRVNGTWPYLADGIDRDTTLTIQGHTGRLEKNGAVLVSEPGKTAYIQTEPETGVYAAFNPFPDPMAMTFTVPGGVTVEADGKLSIARISVAPAKGSIRIDYARRDDQKGEGMATALIVSGLSDRREITLNGECLTALCHPVRIGERAVLVVPLSLPFSAADAERAAAAQAGVLSTSMAKGSKGCCS